MLNTGTTDEGAIKTGQWSIDTYVPNATFSSTLMKFTALAEAFNGLSKYKVLTQEQAYSKGLFPVYGTEVPKGYGTNQ